MNTLTVTSDAARSTLTESLAGVEHSLHAVYANLDATDEDQAEAYDAEIGDDDEDEDDDYEAVDEPDRNYHEACDELEVALDELCSALSEAFGFDADFHDLEEALDALIVPSGGAVTKRHASTAAELIEALTLEAYGESHAGDLPPRNAVIDVLRALRTALDDAGDSP